MTISVSSKDGLINLSIYYESLNITDSIHWDEVVLLRNEEAVTCFGIISSASIGLVNFKDKTWRPDFQLTKVKFCRSNRQQWNKDTSKFETVPVCQDEAKLYQILCGFGEKSNNAVLSGPIKPWINPMYWELGCETETDIALGERFTKSVYNLVAAKTPYRLTDAQIATAREASNKKYGSGGYSKAEATSDKIAANLAFLKTEFEGIVDFKNVYELAQGIEGLSSLAGDDFDYRVYVRMLQIVGIIAGK
jgi:hypothetical protein